MTTDHDVRQALLARSGQHGIDLDAVHAGIARGVRRRRRQRRAATVVGALSVVVALAVGVPLVRDATLPTASTSPAATSTPSPGGVDAEGVADRYGYDVETAQYPPTYALVPEYMDPRDRYAEDLLLRRCLQGVVDYEPVVPGVFHEGTEDRTGQPVFTADIAARLGYSARRLQHRPGPVVPDDVAASPLVQKAMETCYEEADKRLGRPPAALLERIEGAGWDALPTNGAYQESLTAWKVCMQPAEVIDLPDKPDEMPSPSVATPGSQIPDADGNITEDSSVPPSAREVEVAVLDARCRAQVAYDRTERRVRATAELENIGRDLDQFEGVRADYHRYGKSVDDVIAELG